MANNEQEGDWLEGDVDQVKKEQRSRELEFAKNYEIFVSDSRAKAILEHWEQTLLRKITPTDASVQTYAADNAVRDFISKIKHQIELAQERD